MKRSCAVVLVIVVLGIEATFVRAQAPKKKTIWVPPPMGSHIGGHYEDAGDADNKSTSKLGTAQEDTTLGTAVAALDTRANTVVEGHVLLPTAVSIQTKVPVEVLKKQRSASGLSYGQLLVANSLASGSGKSFDEILALRAKTRNWSQLATNLHISVKSIIARVNAADESVKYAESRRRLRREENLKDNGYQRGVRIGTFPGG
jgi:hypothetical protein